MQIEQVWSGYAKHEDANAVSFSVIRGGLARGAIYVIGAFLKFYLCRKARINLLLIDF